MRLGMPYMGSKRKLAKPILDEILQANPKTKYFYDLFGGGAAISFEALKRKKIKKVIYNELNTGITELLKKIQKDGVTKEFYQWVDRDTFKAHKDDNSWFGGLCSVVWSFGNSQKSYLYGQDIEEQKRLLHEIIINQCEKSRVAFNNLYGKELINKSYIGKSRTTIMAMLKKQIGRLDLQQLESIQHLERIQRIEPLEIQNKSYNDVVINTPIDETIIYLDPPYKGMAEYKEGVNHKELLNYIMQSPYKIYISSYEFELPCVAEFKHRCTLSSVSNNKEVTERLFCNKEHNKNTLF